MGDAPRPVAEWSRTDAVQGLLETLRETEPFSGSKHAQQSHLPPPSMGHT